jgi:hypothetical protein
MKAPKSDDQFSDKEAKATPMQRRLCWGEEHALRSVVFDVKWGYRFHKGAGALDKGLRFWAG